jgi:hypothetical protein
MTTWQYPWAEISVGCKPDLIWVGEPANNRALECPFPVVQLPDTVLDAYQVCLIIGSEDDARLRPN